MPTLRTSFTLFTNRLHLVRPLPGTVSIHTAHQSAPADVDAYPSDASTFGFLNLFTRPLGGYLGDLIYRRYGVKGKKYLTIVFGFLQGAMSLAMGLVRPPVVPRLPVSHCTDTHPFLQWMRQVYLQRAVPSLGVQMALVVLMALFCEMANGTNFSLVPHCNSCVPRPLLP